MKALLWKDCRVNRLVLVIGLMALVGPPLVGMAMNLYSLWRYEMLARPWPMLFVIVGVTSLALSLLTVALLGGNAIACERMDRSAEFLAYLPPTRLAIIISKAILAIGTALFIWACNLALVYGVAPLSGTLTDDVIRLRADAVPDLTFMAVFLFGVAWLASSFLDSPAIATGIGIAGPIAVFFVVSLLHYHFHFQIEAHFWYRVLCVTLGVLGFAIGTGYFLRRVEP
jgi:ABC-type transport system involved in multi-copper enzyme maturation permease subunit